MKQPIRILVFVLALSTQLVSACGASSEVGAADPAGGGKPQPAPVEFTEMIESINGSQWTINGQTIMVDPAVVRDGPFNVGDTVKIEASVQSDGSVVATRVETPSASNPQVADASETPESPEVTSTSDPSASATPDPTTGGLVIDNNGNEAFGTIDSMDGNTIVIGGQTFQLANNAEIKDQISAGTFVKVHFTLNADGTISIREIELSNPSMVEDNSGISNSNDNSGKDGSNPSDDGPNHDSNDDKGGGNNSGSGGRGSDDGPGHD
jgi:hypothetical protein